MSPNLTGPIINAFLFLEFLHFLLNSHVSGLKTSKLSPFNDLPTFKTLTDAESIRPQITAAATLKKNQWWRVSVEGATESLLTSSKSLTVRLSQPKVTSVAIQSQRLAGAEGQEADTEPGKGQTSLLKRLCLVSLTLEV